MKSKGVKKSIAYITLNGRIPSIKADGVAVMAMCDQFAKQGLETHLLIPGGQSTPLVELGSPNDIFEYYSTNSFHIHYFPNALGGRISRLTSAYSLAMTLYARKHNYNLINARALEVAVWAARLGIPVILESHNFSRFEGHPMLGVWVSMMKDRSRAVSMVVTTRAARQSYGGIGVPDDRIRVLPNGVHPNLYQSAENREQLRCAIGLALTAPVVAFCGSLRFGRGGEEMLECAARLPDVQMLIVGGAPEDVALYRKLAVERNIYNIKFVGHVEPAVLPRYLLAADILLMPYTTHFSEHSFAYTSPMKMFEYLATGRPMVATDFPILHEVLEHERNAIFVPPDSGAELARGVRYLLDNPELARRIGENAKADAQKYSWKARAAAVIEWQQALGHLD